ncbi:putative receptor protein kinase TMK1 [Iris pallida]|uniref:Receptor protein kinase TMK1 n=1 Tax=Iris pallida TaxID=29817 RepID=A0AAX6HY34_IRIPA|nr:putative receptor protein kinase TMK1 [Iris pallida]
MHLPPRLLRLQRLHLRHAAGLPRPAPRPPGPPPQLQLPHRPPARLLRRIPHQEPLAQQPEVRRQALRAHRRRRRHGPALPALAAEQRLHGAHSGPLQPHQPRLVQRQGQLAHGPRPGLPGRRPRPAERVAGEQLPAGPDAGVRERGGGRRRQGEHVLRRGWGGVRPQGGRAACGGRRVRVPRRARAAVGRERPLRGKWTGVTCDPQGKDVVVLNLGSQKLVGTISPDVAKLTALQKLVLSNNNLTGTIPDSLAGLKSLQLLDVSNNDLSGKVPNFDKSVTVKLSGNPSIGKDVSPGDGGSSGSLPSGSNGGSSGSTSASEGKSKSSTGLIVGIVVAVIVIVGCLAGGLIYYLIRKKREQEFWKVQTKTPPNEPDVVKIGINDVSMGARSELYSQGSNDNVSTIPIEELQRATEFFNDANVIGRGGFGVVYKGMLNGTPIAVKRNESQVMGKTGMAEFEAEVHVLQKTRHRHLVSFLGYCRDNCERLLVYEYMPEGTLGQHLFDREGGKYCPLNWRQRLIIALDVARGIEYLHSLAQESFIHRDLKPSNILLDKDLRAKVSDFGLVKLVDKEKSVMTRLAGTFGYLAPEYALTGKVSTKVDVYAYGVILMELISGRKAIDESAPDEDSHLVMAFRRYIINKDKFLNYVDPSLDLDAEAHENIFQVSELARHCTAREPNQRPSMGHAVQVLSPLVDQWVPSKCNLNLDEDDKNMSLTRTLAKWQSDDDTFSTSFTHNGSTSTFMS